MTFLMPITSRLGSPPMQGLMPKLMGSSNQQPPAPDFGKMTPDQLLQWESDERDFRLGEDPDKEAFASKYGLKHAIDRLDIEIKKLKGAAKPGTGSYEYLKELLQWRNRFDLRLNPDKVPTS